jgi:antitoxin HicB
MLSGTSSAPKFTYDLQGLAKAIGTSRATVNHLLNPDNTSVTLNTLCKAARVLGKSIGINLTEV